MAGHPQWGHSRENDQTQWPKKESRDRTVLVAIIGAVATIAAAVIAALAAHGAFSSPSPSPSVTWALGPSGPTGSATSAAPGPAANSPSAAAVPSEAPAPSSASEPSPDFVRNMVVPFESGGISVIDLRAGVVTTGMYAANTTPESLLYRGNLDTNFLELDVTGNDPYTTELSSANASVSDCVNALESAPGAGNTISNLHTGMGICIATFPYDGAAQPDGVEKIVLTGLDSSDGLHLQESYWHVQS